MVRQGLFLSGRVGDIMSEQEKDPDLKIKLGHNNEIKIKNKYETFFYRQ